MAFDPRLRFPTGFALCKASDPDTSFPNDIAYTSTGVLDTFSTKSFALFKFVPMAIGTFPNLIHQQLIFGRVGVAGTILTTHSDLPQGTTVGGKSGFGMRVVTGDPEVESDYDVRMRAKFVYSDFDILTQTWNNRSSLNEGTATRLLQGLEIDYNVGTFIGGSRTHRGMVSDEFIAPNQLEGMTYFPHTQKTTNLLALTEPGIRMASKLGETLIHGVILEVRITTNRPAKVTSAEAWMGLEPTLAA